MVRFQNTENFSLKLITQNIEIKTIIISVGCLTAVNACGFGGSSGPHSGYVVCRPDGTGCSAGYTYRFRRAIRAMMYDDEKIETQDEMAKNINQ